MFLLSNLPSTESASVSAAAVHISFLIQIYTTDLPQHIESSLVPKGRISYLYRINFTNRGYTRPFKTVNKEMNCLSLK